MVMITEGISLTLDPEFELLPYATPVLRDFYHRQRSSQVLAKRVTQAAWDSVDFGLNLPLRLERLLSRLEAGDFSFNIHVENLDDFVRQLQ